MKSCVIKVGDAKVSELVQREIFKRGIKWGGGSSGVKLTEYPRLVVHGGDLRAIPLACDTAAVLVKINGPIFDASKTSEYLALLAYLDAPEPKPLTVRRFGSEIPVSINNSGDVGFDGRIDSITADELDAIHAASIAERGRK